MLIIILSWSISKVLYYTEEEEGEEEEEAAEHGRTSSTI